MEPPAPPSMLPPPAMGPGRVPPAGGQQSAAVVRRRAPIACRRCVPRLFRGKSRRVRYRVIFPVRGQPDQDREYRHTRARAEKSKARDDTRARREARDGGAPLRSSLRIPSGLAEAADEWDLLPPLPEILESVNQFTRHCFQLGFIPKQLFPGRLRTQHRSASVF
ncbi:hypothetical protein VTH06DRAFT_8435 [Thermothelomyces fergusii]